MPDAEDKRPGLFDRIAKSGSDFFGKGPFSVLSIGACAYWIGWGIFEKFTQGYASEHWWVWVSTWADFCGLFLLFLILAGDNRDIRSLHLKIDYLLMKADAPREVLESEDDNEKAQEEMKRKFRDQTRPEAKHLSGETSVG